MTPWGRETPPQCLVTEKGTLFFRALTALSGLPVRATYPLILQIVQWMWATSEEE